MKSKTRHALPFLTVDGWFYFRFQGKHGMNSLLHITSQEGYFKMIEIIFDDATRIPADREVPIDMNAKNQVRPDVPSFDGGAVFFSSLQMTAGRFPANDLIFPDFSPHPTPYRFCFSLTLSTRGHNTKQHTLTARPHCPARFVWASNAQLQRHQARARRRRQAGQGAEA